MVDIIQVAVSHKPTILVTKLGNSVTVSVQPQCANMSPMGRGGGGGGGDFDFDLMRLKCKCSALGKFSL